MEHHGFILIADITGYTTYLSRSELEHAQGTLTDLLELLLEHTRPPLIVSRLEGDAVFSYALEEGFVSGQTFLESIEDTYVDFRRAIDLMILNNTCRCNACANVSSLDLKFFVHHGSFALQPIGDHMQLLGTDINLIHRLLKNSVTAETGIRAYVLCTEAAATALGIEEATKEMVRHRETVDDLGEVAVWIKDMHPLYEARREADQITFNDQEILSTVETEIAMPPQLVWDYVNQSEFRNVLIGSDRYEVSDRVGGRVGVGSVYQCYHGKTIIPLAVLEWRPFTRVLLRMRLPFPGRPTHVLIDLRLTPTDEGTRLVQTVARPTGTALKRAMARLMVRTGHKRAQKEIDAFRDQVLDDLAARQSMPAAIASISDDQVRSAAAASLQRDG